MVASLLCIEFKRHRSIANVFDFVEVVRRFLIPLKLTFAGSLLA